MAAAGMIRSAPGPTRERAQAAAAARDWPVLEHLCADWIGHTPDDAEAWLLAGVAALETRRPGAALPRLCRAVQLAPRRADAMAQLARALAIAHRLAEAGEWARRALALAPDDALTLDTLGVVLSRIQDHAGAAQAFAAATRIAPDVAGYWFNLASSLKFLGDFAGAERAYEACIAADPHCWKAHSALAQLGRSPSGDARLTRLNALLPAAAGDADALLHLHHALARMHEDLDQPAVAFAHLRAAKQAGRSRLRYDFAEDAALFDAIEAAPLPAGEGHPSREPIFVVGMPRTGTTLIERILSAHSAVYAAGELQHFPLAFKRATGSRTARMLDADTLARAAVVDPREVGAAYLDATRPATGHSAHFLDKMPLNFLYAGAIARALPNAKIVCLRRDPLDTCLSNFRQLFARDYSYYNYAFDLLDCGRYYLRFDRLIAHWQRLLPGRILEVRYEDVVADLEGQARRLLAHCELPWQPACLSFERNRAPVATASAVQVRQPLYASAVGRWRRYATELAPLRALLEAEGLALET